MVVNPVGNHSLHRRITAFEQSLDDQYRYQFGVHYTPPQLIHQVLGTAFDTFRATNPTWQPTDPITVCDPSCGAGAFLVEAAELLLSFGVPVTTIVNQAIVGIDIDPEAVEMARSHLTDWALSHGASRADLHPQIHCGDALRVDWATLAGVPQAGFDLIIGNPPFLGQLSSTTSRSTADQQVLSDRFGFVVGYADTSALFLLQAVSLAAAGGVVALIQPQSILAGSSTTVIRNAVLDQTVLHSLWGCDDSLFEAEVRVCVPTLVKPTQPIARHATPSSTPSHSTTPVEVEWGLPVISNYQMPPPTPHDRWSPLLAPARNIPTVQIKQATTLASIATATAGFRDEFYALSTAAVDDPERTHPELPMLISVGMIDLATTTWGQIGRKIGGTKFLAPRVDLEALQRNEPRISNWVQQRRVPKVLVATQTKVIEAVCDPTGDMVPLTPVVSVEPRTSAVSECALIAAVLNSPVASAWAVAQFLGTGLSAASVRLSAKSILTIPLPIHQDVWHHAAELLDTLHNQPASHIGSHTDNQSLGGHDSRSPDDTFEAFDTFGSLMCAAYGITNTNEVMAWWHSRR